MYDVNLWNTTGKLFKNSHIRVVFIWIKHQKTILNIEFYKFLAIITCIPNHTHDNLKKCFQKFKLQSCNIQANIIKKLFNALLIELNKSGQNTPLSANNTRYPRTSATLEFKIATIYWDYQLEAANFSKLNGKNCKKYKKKNWMTAKVSI